MSENENKRDDVGLAPERNAGLMAALAATGACSFVEPRVFVAAIAAQAALLAGLAMEGAVGYAARRWARGPASEEFEKLSVEPERQDDRRAPRRFKERSGPDRRGEALAAS